MLFNPNAFKRFGQLFTGPWNDDVVNLLQLCLALGTFWVIAWGYRLTLEKRPGYKQAQRDQILLTLGMLGGLAYCNFGNLHFNNFIHTWDTYHYYMGAKYFPELNYERLYDCAVVADAEDGGDPRKVGARAITDLRTNIMVKAQTVLDNPQVCKQHFTPARWDAFKRDVAFFRSRVNSERWTQIHHDHGYNATPVWTLAGYFLTNTGPATLNQVTFVNLFDPLYLLAAAALLWWAFGPRVFALGLIVLGTNYPNRYYWTGGAFLRHDWLFYLVAVVCLLKKERPFLAGMALAYATLLRLFPGLLVVGPFLAGVELVRQRWAAGKADPSKAPKTLKDWVDPAFARFVAGGALGTVLLVGLSVPLVGGLDTWKSFANNTQKHASTPLTNHMGLRTVLSYRPSTIGAALRDGTLIDAWSKWKEVRLEKFQEAKPLFWLLLAGACALIWFGVRATGGNLWVSAALGTGMIAFGAELTCYYYCFYMAMAPLHEKRREVGLLLAAMCAVGQFVAWTPFAGMSGWLDEQYTAMSVAAILATGAIWWLFTEWGARQAVEPEPLPRLAPGWALAAQDARARSESKAERRKKRRK